MNKKNVIVNYDLIWGQFSKGKSVKIEGAAKCVIYTRVSTKEQADNNMSLEIQRKACEQFADRGGLTIMGYFGGTYESAKTDERKEFNRMLSFVKKSRKNINHILVYSVDRFSRTGANAIYIAEQLRREDIKIIAVTQPTDTSTPSGVLQQNIQFIFSEYDNQLRREKSMAGTREALLKGEWCQRLPLGYDQIKSEEKKTIIINEKGKLLRKAFLWKYNEGISNEEALNRLKNLGLKLNHQHISKIFRNPFYCGLMAHSALEGKLAKGNHPPLISKEVFLKVNDVQDNNLHGYSVTTENNSLPLKGTLKCGSCGSNLTGYIVKKKGIHYYKCRTKGCCNNHNAKDLNNTFSRMLSYLVIDSKYSSLVSKQMVSTYNQLNKDEADKKIVLKRNIEEIDRKIDRLEERFIIEEIERELYLKYKKKFQQDRLDIEKELRKTENEVANLNECVDLALEYSEKLPSVWVSSDYNKQQQLQKLLFPEGIIYHKKKGGCRTSRINSVFLSIAQQMQDFTGNKKGIPELNLGYAPLVAHRRIELLFPG